MDYQNKEDVKKRLDELGKKLANKEYSTPEEKHEIHRERWILKNQLSALERGEKSFFVDWIR